MKKLYRKYFYAIVCIDMCCFCIVSLLSVEHVTIRFISMSLLNAVSTNLWCIIIRDAINHILKDDELTNWNSTCESTRLVMAFVGGVCVFFLSDIDIEVCIGMQCVGTIAMGLMDMYAYKEIKVKE